MAAPRIEAITPATAALWHGRAAPAERHVRIAEDARAPLAPHLRFVALMHDAVVGWFEAARDAHAIRFRQPALAEALGLAECRAVMDGFLTALLRAGVSCGFGGLPLETEPGDDQPDHATWLDALRRQGFRERCVYRLHVLPRDDFAATRPVLPRSAPPDLAIRAIDPDALAAQTDLLRGAYAGTAERRDRPTGDVVAYTNELRAIGLGHEPGLWLVAHCRETPAGYVLANRVDDPAYAGIGAWLLEIGCLPDYRGRGIAGALLAALLHRLRGFDCRRLLSTVDVVNAPSVRLHAAFGFRRLPETYFVYRRVP